MEEGKRVNREIQRSTLSKKSHSLGTIHRCFITLGARREDIYIGWRGYIRRYRSIYNRYEKWELEYMAKELWIEAGKKYHPDRAPKREQEIYGYMTAEINVAYDRTVHILNNFK